MAECSITAVSVLNNPAPFTDPIVLEVQYECLCSLQEDLEWRVNYVGSAESEGYDQILDSALVGPVQPGHFKFRMEAPAPDPSKIPADDLLGVTALLLTCSYKGKEFVRVGYYVNVEYADPELAAAAADQDRPRPPPPAPAQLVRSIMADHPRVTKFPHDFDNAPAPMPAPGEGEGEPDDEELLLGDDGGDDECDDDESDDECDDDLEVDEVENVNPAAAAAAGKGGAGAGGDEPMETDAMVS